MEKDIPESCGWWECSILEFNEWTREGRLKQGQRIRRKAVGVGADGDLDRYQQGAYVSMFKSGRIASIWVVPQRFQTFVP